MQELRADWDQALDMLVCGVPKLRIAKQLDVSRNTITAWLKIPTFRIELSRRLDEHNAELKLRRLHRAAAYVDRVRVVAELAFAAAERDPLDPHARRACRDWSRMYLKLRRDERLDLGETVQ